MSATGRQSLARLTSISKQLQTSTTFRRTMASNTTAASATPKPKQEWLVIAPDNAGAFDKRMAVRPQHLSAVMPHVSSGTINLGGAFMSSVPEEGKPLPLIGSAFLVSADTQVEVMELIKNDIYATSGVWDLSKVQVYPFKSAVRNAL